MALPVRTWIVRCSTRFYLFSPERNHGFCAKRMPSIDYHFIITSIDQESMAANTARVMGLALQYAKTSVLYLAAGSTLVLLTFAGLLQFSMFAFYFMELYGFVAMMIFGVSYLMVPAFAHRPLHNTRLANYQYWLFNIGTLGLTLGFSGLIQGDWLKSLQITSFIVQVAALYIHAYNIWRTASGWKGSPGEALVQMGQ
jgi:hypothetical protein